MLRLGNGPEFPIAFLGAIAAGLVPVPTSAQLTEAEITKLAADLDPAAVVAGDGIALPDHPARVIPAEILRKAEDAAPCDYAMGDPNRLAYMIFTSGTGGSARAVMHAHRAIWARQMMYRGWYGMGPDDRLMHAGAFNWTYTLGTGLMDPWTLGATALIPADGVIFIAAHLSRARDQPLPDQSSKNLHVGRWIWNTYVCHWPRTKDNHAQMKNK